MAKRGIILAISTYLLARFVSHGQGLQIHGLEVPIEQRTTLSIPDSGTLPCKDSLSIDFDIKLSQVMPFGNILRLRGGEYGKGNVPTINLLYDGGLDRTRLKLIWEGHRIISSLEVSNEELGHPDKWVHIKLKLDFQTDSVYLSLDKRYFASGQITLPQRLNAVIIFGRDQSFTDIADYSLRDLTLASGGGSNCHFQLSENSGDKARSDNSRITANVSQGSWLAYYSYTWTKLFTHVSPSYQATGYNSFSKEVYWFTRDSIGFISLPTSEAQSLALIEQNPVSIKIGANLCNPADGTIYSYEPYPRDGACVAAFDRESLKFNALDYSAVGTQMHHHNAIVDTAGRRLILFGGFGHQQYNGRFLSFSLDSLKWDSYDPSSEGDKLFPRFQASMGYDPDSECVYIYGGMGNETGEYEVGRQYYYTLHKVELNTMKVTKLWEIPWDGPNTVAVRDMILDGKGCFYTLLYTESLTESELKLYRFSISDGSFEVLASPIPMYSDRITCVGDIYYDQDLERLIATVVESNDDIKSKVTAYSLNYPPKKPVRIEEKRSNLKTIIIIASTIVALLLIFLLGHYILKRRLLRAIIPPMISQQDDEPNTIKLFGSFSAYDSAGKDISYKFTPKLRQLLYLVLNSNQEGGLSSQKIGATLWPEKEESEVKNIKGVTISNLRKALKDIDGTGLVFNDHKFQLVNQPPFHCDYLDFMQQIASSKPDLDYIISLASRGKFLMGENDPLLDRIKEDVEQRLSSILSLEIPRRFALKQFDNSLLCCDILLWIDPLNDDALRYSIQSLTALKRTDEAEERYRKFCAQYKKDYGENYPVRYRQLLG